MSEELIKQALFRLNEEERIIYFYKCRGESREQIADRVNLSHQTIYNRLQVIEGKLQVLADTLGFEYDQAEICRVFVATVGVVPDFSLLDVEEEAVPELEEEVGETLPSNEEEEPIPVTPPVPEPTEESEPEVVSTSQEEPPAEEIPVIPPLPEPRGDGAVEGHYEEMDGGDGNGNGNGGGTLAPLEEQPRNWGQWVLGGVVVLIVLFAILFALDRLDFTAERDPEDVIGAVLTPDPTDTPEPTSTDTPEPPTNTPEPTAIPTATTRPPTPTQGPPVAAPTFTPGPTFTPPPTKTPIPPLSLPFVDNFDNGLSSDFRVVQGMELIESGRLTALTNDGVTVSPIGNLPTTYNIEFDYQISSISHIIFTFGERFRVIIHPHALYWEAYTGNRWTGIAEQGDPDFSDTPGNAVIQIEETKFTIYARGELIHEVNYSQADPTTFSLFIDQRAFIDNFAITQ